MKTNISALINQIILYRTTSELQRTPLVFALADAHTRMHEC